VKALYRHDIQEMWDRSVAPNVWRMVQENLRRYRRAAGAARLRILDVGCAQATLALLLAEDGHEVTALDIRPQFLDYARSRHEKGVVSFVAANVMEYETGVRFDLIFANQIAEHVVYPERLLARLAGWLAPGGRLVVTTPNGAYLKSSLPRLADLGDRTALEDRQFFADGDGHFFAFRADELRSLMAGAGLTRVRVFPFDTPWITGHLGVRHVQFLFPAVLLRAFEWATLRLPNLGGRLAFQLWAEGGDAGSQRCSR